MFHVSHPFMFAALCGVCLTTQAQAVTFGVSRIEIVGNTQGWALAEVQAFESGTGINKALAANGGVASYPTGVDGGFADTAGDTSGSTFGTVPLDANDGNTDGNFGNGSVWHSDDPSFANDTFRITLASPTDLDAVALFGRTDCCQNRDNDLVLNLRDANGNLLFTSAAGIPDQGQTLRITNLTGGTAVVPEPAMMSLLGLAALGFIRRRNRIA